MRLLLSIALKELWASRRSLVLPGLALSLAVASFLIIQIFQVQIGASFRSQGREMLGADLEIEAFRPLAESELKDLQNLLLPTAKISEIRDFNTMLQLPEKEKSQFARIFAVSGDYPFYGQFDLSPPQAFSALNDTEAKAFIPRDVAELLEMKVGDEIRIGVKDFKVAGIIDRNPGGLRSSISFAPRIFIHMRHLAETALLDRPGRVDYMYLIYSPEQSPEVLRSQLRSMWKDPALEISTFENSAQAFQRLFDQIKLFGQLISIAALLISAVGLFGTFQTWFRERIYLIAILRSTGASNNQLRILFTFALFAFSLVVSFIGILSGQGIYRLLKPSLSSVVPLPLIDVSSTMVTLESFCLGLVAPLLFGWLAMIEISSYKPAILLRSSTPSFRFSKQQILYAFLIVFLFWALSAKIVDSLVKGSYVAAGTILVFGVGALLCGLVFKGVSTWKTRSLALQYALRSLLRDNQSTLTTASLILVIGFTLSSVWALQTRLQDEFRVEASVRQSSLFVFDIGTDEKAALDKILSTSATSSIRWSPTLRVRWDSKNGEPIIFDEDEIEEGRRFEGEMFVSESLDLPSTDIIVDGQFWLKAYSPNQPLEISVAHNYARMRNIELGDKLGFSLFGIPFEATVTSLRNVRWTDFQPSFRFLFQPGYFGDLPTQFVGAITTPDNPSRIKIKRDLSVHLPAVSTLDVAEIKEDLIKVTSQLIWVIQSILGFLLILGMAQIAALAREKTVSRRMDMAMLKCLGASLTQLRFFLFWEFLLVSFVPSLIGASLGAVAGALILKEFFNLPASAEISLVIVAIPLGISVLTVAIGEITTSRLYKIKPRVLFSDT